MTNRVRPSLLERQVKLARDGYQTHQVRRQAAEHFFADDVHREFEVPGGRVLGNVDLEFQPGLSGRRLPQQGDGERRDAGGTDHTLPPGRLFLGRHDLDEFVDDRTGDGKVGGAMAFQQRIGRVKTQGLVGCISVGLIAVGLVAVGLVAVGGRLGSDFLQGRKRGFSGKNYDKQSHAKIHTWRFARGALNDDDDDEEAARASEGLVASTNEDDEEEEEAEEEEDEEEEKRGNTNSGPSSSESSITMYSVVVNLRLVPFTGDAESFGDCDDMKENCREKRINILNKKRGKEEILPGNACASG
jgi:hypothetical protein